jgi:retron-type reverse transcriptase
MGLLSWLFGRKADPFAPAARDGPSAPMRRPGQLTRAERGTPELCRRLGLTEGQLRAVPIRYNSFSIPKRSGKPRRIDAPDAELKRIQKLILHRVLRKLKSHAAAVGFERGHSIATNAKFHAGSAVVVRMDIRDFFNSTPASRIRDYFRLIGWDKAAADLLTELCTHRNTLPQGAPTSPRLSNLVNRKLDAMLQKIADELDARYTRYADDLTFSFDNEDQRQVHRLVNFAKDYVEHCGYQLHMKRKLHIRRRNSRQIVTGLVVNQHVALPRETRRWLRAVEHHAATGKPMTLSPAQLKGWRALVHMVRIHGRDGEAV